MQSHPNPKSRFARNRWSAVGIAIPLLLLAFNLTSCSCFNMNACDYEAFIRPGQGAEGLVPGTLTVQRGKKICFKNEDTVAHSITFINSPAQGNPTSQTIDLAPGEKKTLKVHGSKPSGTYECHVVPPARTDGLWPPTEPQVVVE